MLLSDSAGIVDAMVGYRVEVGFDVWWRPGHHHIPLAGDLHNVVLQG